MTSLSNLIIGDNSKFNDLLLVNKASSTKKVNETFYKENFVGGLNEEEMVQLMKEHTDNILSSIDELISEIESATDSINEQSYEHINDGDNILTANQSNQIDEFLIVRIDRLN